MHILLVGLNHKTAPLEVREQVAFPKEQLSDALLRLRDQAGEGVIVSTCNRTEVYCSTGDPARTSERIRTFLASYNGLDPKDPASYVYDRNGADAVRHLFRVASGLDSMIVGESQILGQVRDSLSAASESQSLQVSMAGLFHAAVRTGRRSREETDVGRNALSISYAGVQLAERVLGTLRSLRVLLIGAGEAGQLVAKALTTAGVTDLALANRTAERGQELAQSLGGHSVPFSDIDNALRQSDIVVAATDSPAFIVTHEMVASAVEHGREGPLFLFDLALPRDVDPRVAELDGVKLFNLDDLSAIAEENLEERKRAASDAEAIVEEEVARFMTWWDSLDAVPIVKRLREHAESVRQRELDRALRRMSSLNAEDREVVDALTRSIVNILLHEPTMFLKQRADKAQLETAGELFRLWDDS